MTDRRHALNRQRPTAVSTCGQMEMPSVRDFAHTDRQAESTSVALATGPGGSI
jgi:hypothetical protein